MKKTLIWVVSIATIVLFTFMIYQAYFITQPTLEDILKKSNFSQTNPPNNLAAPGTIALIDSENSGVIKVICPCKNAFGDTVESKFIESASTDIDLTNKITGEFNLDLSFLQKLSFNPSSKLVRNISLKLSNVKILELPDDAVFQLLKNRTPYCIQAINNRKKEGSKVTLIKRVIQADAEYTIEFSNEISNDSKSDIIEDLSIELTGKTSTTTSNKIVGKNLYWGIDDDASLGSLQPGELPSTGSSNRQRFTNKKSIYKIEYEKVHHNVKPIKQPTEMSCWATVYTMMLSWKEQKEYTIEEVINKLGDPWKEYFTDDTGLPTDKVLEFLEATGMAYKPPASYQMEVYEKLLKEKGPIWITSGDGFNSHAKLLTGIYSNDKGNVSTLEFIDPLSGKIQRMELLEFIAEYEKEARFINSKRPDIPFRIQILYFK